MESTPVLRTSEELGRHVLEQVFRLYNSKLQSALSQQPALLAGFPGFLVRPEQIVVHVGREHIAIEYYGPERIDEAPEDIIRFKAQVFDYSQSTDDFLD